MLILGLDLETTGLNTDSDKIIELGACLWDTRSSTPLQMVNTFVKVDHPLSEEVKEVTGIEDWMLEKYGLPLEDGIHGFQAMMEQAEALCAHNGQEFDYKLLANEIQRVTGKTPEEAFPNIPRIDTRMDLPFGDKIKSRSLSYLAADHGFLNPFPHRAITDVLTMLKILSFYDLEVVLARSKSPSIRVVATVSFARKDEAKQRGYHWDGEKKEWHKTIKELDWEKELKLVGGAFKITAQRSL